MIKRVYLIVRDALSRKERDGLVFSSLGLGKRDFGAFSGYVLDMSAMITGNMVTKVVK
ncbi:hypothetical protein [Bartonella henselae]|uniref:hypothetical protein n=1 Tax=Bartonella henselae TaxID=38323 RepID=UPI000A95E66A|nr:hypothetical protein [Bartonella henselae]MDM9996916.1 hypothetical protein [Bartonella henselae]UJM43823.1 hypothetical protein KAE73_03625 [Bartonella henselae]